MSNKSDKLKFAVKQSLVVGTATAAIGAAGCISNSVPNRNDTGSADAGNTDTTQGRDIVNPVPDTTKTVDTAPANDADDATSDAQDTTIGRDIVNPVPDSNTVVDTSSSDDTGSQDTE